MSFIVTVDPGSNNIHLEGRSTFGESRHVIEIIMKVLMMSSSVASRDITTSNLDSSKLLLLSPPPVLFAFSSNRISACY